MRVHLVRVAGQIDVVVRGDGGQRLVFGAVDLERRLVAPAVDRVTHREAGQEILGHDDETGYFATVQRDELLAGRDGTAGPLDILDDLCPGRGPVRQCINAVGAKLKCQGRVAFQRFFRSGRHNFPHQSLFRTRRGPLRGIRWSQRGSYPARWPSALVIYFRRHIGIIASFSTAGPGPHLNGTVPYSNE